MRNRLATAILMALLGLVADPSPLAAQQSPFQLPAWQTQPRPPGRQSTDLAEKARKEARRSGHAHRKHNVVRSLPNQRKIAENKGYKRVSDLVNFPKFFPGLGVVFVKPDTLPLGPFLCFDHRDRLVATVYMPLMKDLDDHKSLEAPGGFAAKVDHVSIYFNAGHPGVDQPHYHVVIWHVSRKNEARVAK